MLIRSRQTLFYKWFIGRLGDFWVPQRAAAGPRSEGPVLAIKFPANRELYFFVRTKKVVHVNGLLRAPKRVVFQVEFPIV